MEHSEYDIKTISFGNFWLDKWLENEEAFKKRIVESAPTRLCLTEIYRVLVKLNQLPTFWKSKDLSWVKEAVELAKEWSPGASEAKIDAIAQAILVLNNLAEKRLSVSSG